jgi:hypothetical protein
MIVIGNVIVSDDVKGSSFVCNLKACKGACCIEGESGAPLEKEELEIMEKIYPIVESYITDEGKKAIAEQGTYVDAIEDGIKVFETPLMGKHGACAYVNFSKDGIAYCGIEKAYEDGKIEFQKPISCHLYPIRITQYDEFTAVNVEEWAEVCGDACDLGKKLQVPVYKFLKGPLVRKFGQKFYDLLAEEDK